MKFGKKTALVALMAASALVFAGCAGGGDVIEEGSSSGGSSDGEMYIAMVSKGFQHQFWQAVKKGAEDKAKELGVKITFEGPAAETEIAAMKDRIGALRDRLELD